MSHARRASALALAALLLAGCGGGGGSSMLPSSVSTNGVARDAQSTSTITPTLYVSGQGTIYVYDLNASGSTAPNKVLGSFYSAADASPTAIAGIASNRKGDLYVLQNYGGSEGPSAPSCQVWMYTANATGGLGAPPAKAYQCGPGVFYGQAIQLAPNGEVDVLDTIDNLGATGWHVERFFASQTTQYSNQILNLTPNQTYTGLGAGSQGNIFAAYSGAPSHIDKYAPLAVGNAAATVSANDTPGTNNYGPVAAGLGSVYVATQDRGSLQWSVTKFSPNLGTQTVGYIPTLPVGDTITALVVDASGNLYVGITAPGTGTIVAVYSSGGAFQHLLAQPVRKANPANDGSAVLTGLAISQ